MRSTLAQNVLNLVIIGIIAALLIWVSPVHNSVANGILLPSGQPGSPISAAQVKVVNQIPSDATLAGVIDTSMFPGSGNTDDSQALYQQSIDYAKQLAAQDGATMIDVGQVINYVRAGPLNVYQLQIAAAR